MTKYRLWVCGNRQRMDVNGYSSVRIRATFNNYICYIPLSFRYKFELITESGLIPDISVSANKHLTYTKEINEVLEKIKKAFAENVILQPDSLLKLIKGNDSKDFIDYWHIKALSRTKNLEIQYSTYRVQNEALNSLKEFKGIILFSEINVPLIEAYKAFLKHKGLSRNTIWTRLKDIRTYCNLAIKEGITFEYPFGSKFKMPKAQSKISYLSEPEFNSFKDYLILDKNPYHTEILKAYLFSCYTGLRISDIKKIKGKNLKGNKLIFEPQKTSKSESKRFLNIEVPLHQFAITLLPINPKKENLLFELPAESKINLRLKEICKILNIDPISYHSSRHTFATRFLRFGGNVTVLQKLLGHENISTTMIYVHIDSSHSTEQINQLT